MLNHGLVYSTNKFSQIESVRTDNITPNMRTIHL
nr:MAG TPA: hypothetical protein [Caudoviricetes sp.]